MHHSAKQNRNHIELIKPLFHFKWSFTFLVFPDYNMKGENLTENGFFFFFLFVYFMFFKDKTQI